jgi:hypothetical protein
VRTEIGVTASYKEVDGGREWRKQADNSERENIYVTRNNVHVQ